jgi:hypothetical protein
LFDTVSTVVDTSVGGLQVHPGCCSRMVPSAVHRGPSSCLREVTWAGTLYFSGVKELWLAFACDHHRDVLTNPHQPTTAERVELDRRRRAWADALSGKPWRPPKPLRDRAGR